MSDKLDKTGIYMRLSRDDEKSGESMSIENQRIILKKYVAENGGTLIDEYVDDGWSGTNFNRPAVKRLLDDARSGRINTIVVKDLSRFGRNYIQAGQYIDYIFPAYGIRFIALSDNIDTSDRDSTAMDMMPIMNVFNEWHAANTSKKIRTVLEASQRSGKYTNWNYPYGYKAGTDSNRTAVVDSEAASVVKRIFGLRLQGNSARAIAKILTGEGIPNPATYFRKLNGEKSDRVCSPFWVSKTVMWILSNPTYTGKTIQHKTTSVSYKNHKVIKIPENEMIIKENAHEAIISRDIWDRVQQLNNSVSRGRADKNNNVHALSGLLVCADCGKKLKLKTVTHKNKSVTNYFVCRTYADLGKSYCTSHSITENEIVSILLKDIKSMLGAVKFDTEKAKQNFIRRLADSKKQNGYSDEKQLKVCNNRLNELDRLIQSAFEEKILKNLPENLCTELCKRYIDERECVKAEIENIKKRIDGQENKEDIAQEYLKKIKSYLGCETLTRELCLQLVELITVGEKGKDGYRELNIYYKFKP